jgi:hypothetical protein
MAMAVAEVQGVMAGKVETFTLAPIQKNNGSNCQQKTKSAFMMAYRNQVTRSHKVLLPGHDKWPAQQQVMDSPRLVLTAHLKTWIKQFYKGPFKGQLQLEKSGPMLTQQDRKCHKDGSTRSNHHNVLSKLETSPR